jgi:hypothetical protein
MDVHHQTRSDGSLAPIDSECASIAMRLVLMCGEFIKAGEPQKALEAYHHARDILDDLASSQRHNVDLGLTLSLLHPNIGELKRARGDLGEAKEAYQSSLAIVERLDSFHPGNEELRRNRAEALTALSTVSDTIGFEPKLDSAVKRLKGFPSLCEALASATDSRIEAPAPATEVEASAAERRVVEPPRELPLEVRDRVALDDLPGQFIHNIPRRMRVGALETVEVRIPCCQGDEAITVRLRAPEGGFLIDLLSPETCWTAEAKGDGNECASWRWSITPQRRGKVPLRLIISAQTLDANRMTAKVAPPDQVVMVSVRGDHSRTARRVAGWGLLMLAGGALNAWGRELYPPALEAVGWLWGLLERWSL